MRTIVKVVVVLRMFSALSDRVRLVKVAVPTAGPWPGSGRIDPCAMVLSDSASGRTPILSDNVQRADCPSFSPDAGRCLTRLTRVPRARAALGRGLAVGSDRPLTGPF